MDPVWIAVAFVLGHAVRFVGLPPLVGFLAAGFVLWAFDVEGGEALDKVGDIGVYLLLFGIGLKLKLGSLLRPEIWGVGSVHMAITTVFFGGIFLILGVLGIGLATELDLFSAAIVGFALSFSSTVFAVKILEESGQSAALHGRIAIGILILQDIIAVVFLTVSLGKTPSPWALALLGLPLLRPFFMWVMTRSGHGELLVLFGLLFVFASTNLFELVGMKPDLGAIVFGVLVGSHPKANELSNALMGFKDLFLVGFFLTIGLKGIPSLEGFGIALLLTVLIPLKVALFFMLMTRFRLRVRTSMLGSLSLANYSEFGLIVGAVATAKGWLSDEWLVIVAVALALSFIVAAPFNTRATILYRRLGDHLRRFESTRRIPGDELIDPGEARIAIVGMGRVGTGAYDELRRCLGDVIVGIDRKQEVVNRHKAEGRNVVLGDATDLDFYKKLRTPSRPAEVVMLAMSNHREILTIAELLKGFEFKGQIAATVRYPDQIDELKAAGVDAAFDILAEAGAGFADEVTDLCESTPPEA
jgi:predicted Kef-type K+ transport protein